MNTHEGVCKSKSKKREPISYEETVVKQINNTLLTQ